MMRYDTPGIFWDMPGLTYDDPADLPLNLNQPNPMAQDQTKRVDPKTLQSDIAALQALQGIAGYAPANAAFALAALGTKQSSMTTTQTTETQKQADANAARDAAVAAEWAFHNAILGAKDQVKAQFGADSDQWQALGMIKKSERKKPTKKPKPNTGP